MTEVRANKRTYAIGLYLLSGWLPWGVDLDRRRGRPEAATPSIPLCAPLFSRGQARWIVCCGHTLSTAEVERWKAAGLMVDGEPDARGRPCVVAGPGLERWLGAAFNGLHARRWGRA
jgi:hypothetical protein